MFHSYPTLTLVTTPPSKRPTQSSESKENGTQILHESRVGWYSRGTLWEGVVRWKLLGPHINGWGTQLCQDPVRGRMQGWMGILIPGVVAMAWVEGVLKYDMERTDRLARRAGKQFSIGDLDAI
eukprot:766862-Hanusia_phi.AAC.4